MKKLLSVLLACLLTAACAAQGEPDLPSPSPTLALELPRNGEGVPTLSVYVTAQETIIPMDLETYVAGVVAGEMKNDWPLEALKAQAILARTFVLRFVSEKESRYEGADISTDIEEAQAYDESAVNDRVRQAVEETAGLVLLTPGGTLPYTWFHAHSGGMTAPAREGLGWKEAEPAYTLVTEGLESDEAPAEARAWAADFPVSTFINACRKTGADVTGAGKVSVLERGESGRALTLSVDGAQVSAPELRLALGSTVMRSTLLTELSSDGQTVHMAGKGYGHGVGMSQWGAYALAMDGLTGEDIALHYYNGLSVARLW